MAQISRSVVSLRIMGEDLVPEEISAQVGCEPTQKYSKGDVSIGKNTGRKRIYKSGMWRLEASECIPEDIDTQVSEILAQMTQDLEVWKELNRKYDIDLFCGLFMEVSNEGLDISPSSLKSLGERGVLLALDIYDPD